MKKATWFFLTPEYITPWRVFWRSLLMYHPRDAFGDVVIQGVSRELITEADSTFRFAPIDTSRFADWPCKEPRFLPNYNKLDVLRCDEYDQILVLDSDMICTGYLGDVLYSEAAFLGVGVGWPDNPRRRFNGGLWRARRPILGNPDALVEIAQYAMRGELFDKTEQSALVVYLEHHGYEWELLPSKYNLELGLANYEQFRPRWHANVADCRVLHMTGPWKPWATTPPKMGYRERFRALWERAARGERITAAHVAAVEI